MRSRVVLVALALVGGVVTAPPAVAAPRRGDVYAYLARSWTWHSMPSTRRPTAN